MVMTMTNAGNLAIKRFFQAHNISGASASRALGLSKAYISRLLSNERVVSPTVRYRFHRAYCNPASPLFFDDAITVITEIDNDLERAMQRSAPHIEAKPAIIEAKL